MTDKCYSFMNSLSFVMEIKLSAHLGTSCERNSMSNYYSQTFFFLFSKASLKKMWPGVSSVFCVIQCKCSYNSHSRVITQSQSSIRHFISYLFFPEVYMYQTHSSYSPVLNAKNTCCASSYRQINNGRVLYRGQTKHTR